MKRDKIFDHLEFTSEFSVDDWNETLRQTLRKYFDSEELFESNKEILRTELVNYLRIYQDKEYFNLFEWTFQLFKDVLESNKNEATKLLADFFYETSATDFKWMTFVLTQPDIDQFSEHDKINHFFKIIDDTLEGTFKPRFKLLYKMAQFRNSGSLENEMPESFGQLINNFPKNFIDQVQLFIKDPLFSVPTNQWRNIAAHKSFTINPSNIIIEYGTQNKKSLTISYSQISEILSWTQKMYRALRFAQVLIDLNHIKEIIEKLGGTEKIRIRFESSLFHLIHNMQVVGFRFISTEELSDVFNLNFRPKVNEEIKSSVVHASQCLCQLSCNIHDDSFVKDKFKYTKVSLLDEEGRILAAASVEIINAMAFAEGKMSMEEYVQNVEFKIHT